MRSLIKILGILCVILALVLGIVWARKSIDTHYENLYDEKVAAIEKKHAESRSGLLSQLDLLNSKVSVGKENRASSDAKIEGMEKEINRLLSARHRKDLSQECKKIISEINCEFQLLVGERNILKERVNKLISDIESAGVTKDQLIASHVQEKADLKVESKRVIGLVEADLLAEEKKNIRAKITIVLLLLIIAAQAI